ncbi:hypothetical protein F2Q70_00003551 [Brassica cretica]|uniref:Uncharacterized protein n=1 Tax=Brassica cretica TaxID=69181 RepID=A0A8S9J2J2_BRACR|nr:hypothetical protein F2Q70_00003551 [Brassica cretica]
MPISNVTGMDTNTQVLDTAVIMEMMKNIMNHITCQDKAKKITKKHLAEITATIKPPGADPTTLKRQLFHTRNLRLKEPIKRKLRKSSRSRV